MIALHESDLKCEMNYIDIEGDDAFFIFSGQKEPGGRLQTSVI